MYTELVERLAEVVSTDLISMAVGELLASLRWAAGAALIHRVLRPRQVSFEHVAEHEQATNPFGYQPADDGGE